MASKQKAPLSRMFDMPLLLGASLTIAFYIFVHQPAMHDTLLHRYTTHHVVEYIIVGFFIWGLCDVLFKVLSFPRQSLALRHEWLPPRKGRGADLECRGDVRAGREKARLAAAIAYWATAARIARVSERSRLGRWPGRTYARSGRARRRAGAQQLRPGPLHLLGDAGVGLLRYGVALRLGTRWPVGRRDRRAAADGRGRDGYGLQYHDRGLGSRDVDDVQLVLVRENRGQLVRSTDRRRNAS